MECKNPGHANCQELFGKLSEYLDRELEPSISGEIEAHLAECLACRACLQTLKRTIAFCGRAEDAPMPEMFSKKLHDFLQLRTKPATGA